MEQAVEAVAPGLVHICQVVVGFLNPELESQRAAHLLSASVQHFGAVPFWFGLAPVNLPAYFDYLKTIRAGNLLPALGLEFRAEAIHRLLLWFHE